MKHCLEKPTTNHMSSEPACRWAADELSAISENSDIALILLADDRKMLKVNQRCADLFGYGRPDKMEGLSSRAIHLSDKTFKTFGKEYYNSIKAGEQFLVEYPFRRRDGTEFWGLMSGKALDTARPPDLTKGVLWAVDEISAQKAIARQKAQEVDRTKSDFLAYMSHEIRTPLNAIIGMTYLLSQQHLASEQADYVRRIEKSSKALLGLINDIHDFSKIEAGKLEIENYDFDLHSVIENVSILIELKALEKHIGFIVSYTPGINVNRHGDPLRIGQILTNLATNAVKFTEKGEIGIYVQQAKNGMVRFEVRDTGIGMSRDQQARIFKSFSQADASTTRKYGGTGLGLTISRQLVNLMQGRIWVESTQGQGSAFIFEIPLEERQAPEIREPSFAGKRALIVDDTPSWLEVLKNMLVHYGIETHTARSGEEALALICEQDHPFDLVFMDWHMPGQDGIETTRQIKERLGVLPPTIVMVSAYKKESVQKAARQAGINFFLNKPINPSTFHNVILGAFGNKGEPGRGNETKPDRASLKSRLVSLKGSTILLVEDNALNREIIHGMLANSGIVIDDAHDGRLAVEKFKAAPDRYELILMDIQMPVMDGYEACRQIRELNMDIPIVALTAHALMRDIQRTREAGMNEHLNKPIEVEKLFAALLKYISQKCDIVQTEETPEEKALSGVLSGLTCIDVDSGLSRLMGNRRLYVKLLRNFAVEYNGVQETLSQLMEDDPTSGARMVHTIKGLSAAIGAEALHKASVELDQAHDPELIPEFCLELDRVITQIKTLPEAEDLEDKDSGTDKKALGTEQRNDIFKRLVEGLQRRRPQMIKPVLAELKEYALSKEDAGLLKDIEALVYRYKFKDALNVLEAAAHE